MNISSISSSAYSPQFDQLQAAKNTVPAATDRDHDGDTDKAGQADTNDGARGPVGVNLDTKA